jgi:hypothetical protein
VKDGALLGDVARLSERVAERPVQVQHAGRPERDGQFPDQTQADRRHALSLDLSCKQSHGPRAEWSGWDEQHKVDLSLPEAPGHLPGRDQ